MIVEFLEDAEQELLEAVLWYESKEVGLGIRFRNEVAHVVNRIAEDPLLWRARTGMYRQVNCPVFLYSKIIILAIAHGLRKPGYWKSRCEVKG